MLGSHIDQWNRTESLEVNACIYSQLIYGKGGKNIQWGKDSLFNNWFWGNWTATCKRMKLEHSLTGYTKNTIKMDKTLKTIKLQEENIGSMLFDMSAIFFVSVSSSMGKKSNNKEM